MKIITQNLEFLFDSGTHVHSGKEWQYTPEYVQARIDHFGVFFKSHNADVIFLQELASEDVLKKIIEKTEIDYSYFIAASDINGIINAILIKSDNASFESIPCHTSIPVFVTGDQDTIGPRLWSRRDFAYVQSTHNGKPLHLICVHLKSNFAMPEQSPDNIPLPINTQIAFADGMIRSELFRASQAKKARELIDQIFTQDPDAQVVVAGDFNTQQSNPIFKIVQGGIKSLPDYLKITSKMIPEEHRYSIVIGEDKYLADHILISQSLFPNLISVTTNTGDLPTEKNIYPNPTVVQSDHAAVILELK